MTVAETLIANLKKRADISVSNDVAGIFGQPVRSERFWQKVLPTHLRFQIEYLSWRWLIPDPQKTLERPLPRLAGYHGRMGVWSSDDPSLAGLTMGNILDNMLTSTSKMNRVLQTQQALPSQKRPFYLLLHHPEAALALNMFASQSEHTFVIAIENHTRQKAVSEVWRLLAAYKAAGVPAVMVFDLVHALHSLPPAPFPELWQQVLEQLDETGPCLVHLPVGTRSSDSLDSSQLSDEMLANLGEVMQRHSNYPILEHQLGSFDGKFFPLPEPAKQEQLVTRTHAFVHRLQQHQILPE